MLESSVHGVRGNMTADEQVPDSRHPPEWGHRSNHGCCGDFFPGSHRDIAQALREADGKIFGPGGAAARLGMKPTTLASRIKALGISAGSA